MDIPQGAPSVEELEKKGAGLNAFAFGLVSFIAAILMFVVQFMFDLVSWIPAFGFIASVLGMFSFWVYLIAIIFGALAKGKAKKAAADDPKAKKGKTFGTLGLVFGIVGIVLNIILAILAILAVVSIVFLGIVGVIIMLVISMLDPAVMQQINDAVNGTSTYLPLLLAIL